MNNIQYVEPLDWAVQSAEEPWKEDFKTIHFDCFKDYQSEVLKGIALLNYSCDLLKKVSEWCSNFQTKNIKPWVYLPLECSKTTKEWREGMWQELGNYLEPPSLYIVSAKHVFTLCIEEYKRPIDLPIQLDFPITGIFRCIRSMLDMKNNWEFQVGIDLYKEGDF